MKFILIATMIFTFGLNAPLLAEEEAEKNDVSSEDKEIDEENSQAGLEEFVPSEEISIDKPVAFPVDI